MVDTNGKGGAYLRLKGEIKQWILEDGALNYKLVYEPHENYN